MVENLLLTEGRDFLEPKFETLSFFYLKSRNL